MDKSTKNNSLRNFILIIAGIILMGVMVVATTTISDTGIITTGNIIAQSINVSGDVTIIGTLSGASPISIGHEGILFTNESDDVHYSIYHAVGNFSQSFINVSTDFDGTMIFQSDHITNINGLQMCFWDVLNQEMVFCVNDDEARATTIRDSFQIVGENKLSDNNFNSCSGTNFIDCNSSLTGPDLLVQDDIEAQSIFANENIEATGNITIGNQIQIKGGAPGADKVLTSDANGLARWTLASGGGWSDAGVTIILTNINDDVGIGESGPDTKLHVTDGGSSGASPFSNTIATFESPNNGYLSILTPNANERGIFFGEPASQVAGGIIYNDAATLDGLQFRTNGNNIRMVIAGDGNVGIGTSSPIINLHVVGSSNQETVRFQAGDGSLVLEGSNVGSNDPIFTINWTNTDTITYTSAMINSFNAGGTDDGDLRFYTTQAGVIAEQMRIDEDGDLSFPNDMNLTTGTGGVFKFVNNAFQSGQDSSNYLEIGHGGSNSFLNQVGAGGMDFRFAGVTKATFTTAGHLHLMTDTDQKHTLKIITADNLQDTGIAWENSGGSFTHTIFRTDVGSNRADLVFAVGLNSNIDLLTNSFRIHGEASDEGNVEFFQDVGIGTSSPAQRLDVNGSMVVDNDTLFVDSANNEVGINTITPNAAFEVVGVGGSSVGGFASGALHLRDPSTAEFRNAVITGHNSFNGNTQLWYLGSTSSSNNNVAFINRQAGEIHLHTNDLRVLTIDVDGNIDFDRGNLTLQDKITFRLAETIDNLVNGWVRITGSLNVTGDMEVAGNITVDMITDNTIFAQLSSSVDQIPTNVSSVPITYDTQDAINGLNHSTSVNQGEITILTSGMYFVSPQPQVGKDQGATEVVFDMYLQVDRGAGFVNEPNSNIKLSIKDADITDVIVSAFTISLDSGDKIRLLQKVSDSGVGMGLKNTNATAEVPRTPSIIFTMYRVGGQPL